MHNMSNLPLTYCNGCKSKNSVEKAALKARQQYVLISPIALPGSQCNSFGHDGQLALGQPCPVKFN